MVIRGFDQLEKADFPNGITILVDKPLNWTSFDVVNKLRFVLKKRTGLKKLKVGHAGTLDPLATGLLIISIGKDTPLLNSYQDLDKVYSGTMSLGASTPSYDAEFEPDNFFPVSHIDQDLLDSAKNELTGEISQIPPVYSAVRIDGEKAYQRARKGEDFIIKKRQVKIFSFEILNLNMPELDFRVHCQKGTYIRSLVHDFGKLLNSGAYLVKLNREKIGDFDINEAFNLNDLIIYLEKNEKI
ncbi:MAG: tRNA pseudouridine(55) synthase TruB [Saprospiraceae bacterium]|nr:tRNA pseudouridine(55) synthase TruB [Saprospiraceae bacterium]